jgi:hypothetical protein
MLGNYRHSRMKKEIEVLYNVKKLDDIAQGKGVSLFMNNDLKTTILGVLSGLAVLLPHFGVSTAIASAAQAIALTLWGLYTNKA